LCIVRVDQSLSLNEARNVALARHEPAAVFSASFENGKSPLYIAVLKLWAHCFGYTDFAMRMLSVICGALLVLFIYLFIKKFRGARLAIPVTLLVASSPILIIFGARVNALSFTLAGVVLIAGIIISIIKRQPKRAKKPHYSITPLIAFLIILTANIVGLMFVYNIKPPVAKDISQTIAVLDAGSDTAITGDTDELYYVLAVYAERPVYRSADFDVATAGREEIWQVTILDAEGKPRTDYNHSGWRVAEYSTMQYQEGGDLYAIVKLEKE
jgi:hypothetical protein